MVFKEVPTLIQETALWWAAHWRSPESRMKRMPRTLDGGIERFQSLLVTFGLEIADAGALGQWEKLETRLCMLADEMRFRIFEDREDAVQATINAIAMALEAVGYRTENWAAYSTEFAEQLRSPHSKPATLKKCIRAHFVRPSVHTP